MTARERRIAELAAKDLDSWARELPIGSETRRDLQQTARAYRFAARAGAGVPTLRAVPAAGDIEAKATSTAEASHPSAEPRSREPGAIAALRELHTPAEHGA